MSTKSLGASFESRKLQLEGHPLASQMDICLNCPRVFLAIVAITDNAHWNKRSTASTQFSA